MQIEQAAIDAVHDYLSFGWQLVHAVATPAMEKFESDFNPRARGDYIHGHIPTAFGLYQMHWSRGEVILRGCGIDMRTASARDQRRALVWELKNVKRDALRALTLATTPYAAGVAMTEWYEIPANIRAQEAIRGNYAVELYRAMA